MGIILVKRIFRIATIVDYNTEIMVDIELLKIEIIRKYEKKCDSNKIRLIFNCIRDNIRKERSARK